MERIFENAPWLQKKGLQKLLLCLSLNGDEARIVGGAVRNQLMGKPINDVDIATTCLPDETISSAQKAGFKAIPTGYEFGTITVVANGEAYEVTTLRADIETDGRHAKVLFGRDWQQDAQRRDFTINALYADASGKIYDDVGGLADIASGTLRFIGEAEERIREDYLRILRFFRFFAWYGRGRPDAEGLKACTRLKAGVEQLSSERVWAEMKKLLSAPDPSRALLWMRQTGVLTVVLPETEKWGIDAIHALVDTGRAIGWTDDPMLRLESLLPPDAVRLDIMAKRLRFSKAEKDRILNWAKTDPIQSDCADLALKKLIYRKGRQPVLDKLALALADARARAINDDQALLQAGRFARLRDLAESFELPTFPVSGKDMLLRGFTNGPLLGQALKAMEQSWIDSGFLMDRDTLIASLTP
ncbi:CCA tRNA nucleotidyltransferase [Bartonella sp. LJL80]